MIYSNWLNKILISTPRMRQDSTFDRSVIYIYEESPQHVAGLILNKPTKTKVERIFQIKGFKTINLDDLVFSGGPVNQDSILILHTDEWKCKNTLKLGNGFSLTSDALMMKKIHEQDKPQSWRVFSGLSLWSPGQLEGEIESKCWLTAEPDTDLILNTPIKSVYEKAIEMCGRQVINRYI